MWRGVESKICLAFSFLETRSLKKKGQPCCFAYKCLMPLARWIAFSRKMRILAREVQGMSWENSIPIKVNLRGSTITNKSLYVSENGPHQHYITDFSTIPSNMANVIELSAANHSVKECHIVIIVITFLQPLRSLLPNNIFFMNYTTRYAIHIRAQLGSGLASHSDLIHRCTTCDREAAAN